MSWLQTTRRIQVSSTIPTDVSPDDVIDLLHDHERFTRMQPFIVDIQSIKLSSDAELLRESPSNEASAYTVTERVPWWGTIKFNCSLLRHPDGVESVVFPGMGLKMHVYARVRQLENAPNWWLLEEDCELVGSSLLMSFVVSSFKKAHEELHQKMLRQLAGSGTKD